MKMVHTTLRVDFWLIGSRSIGELSAFQDVEVVVGGMTACVAFGAHCGACESFSNTFPRSGKGGQTEDDKVFCDAWGSCQQI